MTEYIVPLELKLLQVKLYNSLKSQAQYRAQLRAAVRGFWTRTFDFVEFYDAMISAIEIGFNRAWAEGMAAVGLEFADITPEEEQQLANYKFSERNYIFGFGEAIEAVILEGGPLEPLFARVEKWLVRYTEVKNAAMLAAKNDPKLEWVVNAKESCSSCLKLSGKVKRASLWARADIRPQHRALACMLSSGGIPVCKCQLLPTDAPVSRGRLPNIP